MTDTTNTEAGCVAELAQAAIEPSDITINGRRVLLAQLPHSWTLQQLDLEHLEAAPHRKRGTVAVHTTQSLLDYLDLQMGTLTEHGGAVDRLPTIWVQPDAFTAVAILNGHTDAGPGWGDHRAELHLRRTPEWNAWVNADKAWFTAAEFAELIEEWRHTISDPPTADLLDMVRHFRATTKVTFRQEVVDKSGDRALEYVTETEATAGPSGKLEIPDGFGLVLAPFEGAEPRALRARFRYRLDGGQARFGVVLEQPALVAKAAFDAEVVRIEQHAPFVVLVGTPGR